MFLYKKHRYDIETKIKRARKRRFQTVFFEISQKKKNLMIFESQKNFSLTLFVFFIFVNVGRVIWLKRISWNIMTIQHNYIKTTHGYTLFHKLLVNF